MILRIFLSIMLIIPFICIGVFFLLNIGNEIREIGRERELELKVKREKQENAARQEIIAGHERDLYNI